MSQYRQDRVTQDLLDSLAVYNSMLDNTREKRLSYEEFLWKIKEQVSELPFQIDPACADYARAYGCYVNYHFHRLEYERKKEHERQKMAGQ